MPRVRGGDPAGFQAVVRAFEGPVRTWIAAHGPPGGDADDLAHASPAGIRERGVSSSGPSPSGTP
jgi:hypothetical protein